MSFTLPQAPVSINGLKVDPYTSNYTFLFNKINMSSYIYLQHSRMHHLLVPVTNFFDNGIRDEGEIILVWIYRVYSIVPRLSPKKPGIDLYVISRHDTVALTIK